MITNSDAGTADEENLEAALDGPREHGVGRGRRDLRPGRAGRRAAPRRVAADRGGRRRRQPARGGRRRCTAATSSADAVVGLLPLGTGNDFARGIGIPLDVEEAARLVLDGEVRPVDLIVDELGEIVVNNVHVGAGAEASRKGARWKARLGSVGVGKVNLGRLGYPIGAVLSAFHPPSVRLRVEVDGEVVNDLDRPVLMVALGNGANVGGGTELTPRPTPRTARST